MTIEDIKRMDKQVLTPADVAPLLGCHPNTISRQAERDVKQLGFPCARIGTRTKIPKDGFVSWFEGVNNYGR